MTTLIGISMIVAASAKPLRELRLGLTAYLQLRLSRGNEPPNAEEDDKR